MNTTHLHAKIQPQRNILLHHPLYDKIKTVEDLNCFLENHVYAVWDFMSLLKALQQKLTCTTIPWYATADNEMRYLINEIVLAEESDVATNGARQSHFEMYLEAMHDLGADTTAVENFIAEVFSLQNIFVAIRQSPLHRDVKSFLDFTFRVIEHGKPHQIAAAFTFGREDLIPAMFTEILRRFQSKFPETRLDKLIYYFERHIKLDAEEHGPMAMQMVEKLCGSDEKKWKEAENIAAEALLQRIGLWNAIEAQLQHKLEMV